MYEYGGCSCDPIDSECATWNSGAALKAFVSSARRPEKLELFKKTSRCTSLAIPSTVPGLASPNASLRSWNAEYALSTCANGPVCAVCGCVIMPATACSFVGLGLNSSGVAMVNVIRAGSKKLFYCWGSCTVRMRWQLIGRAFPDAR